MFFDFLDLKVDGLNIHINNKAGNPRIPVMSMVVTALDQEELNRFMAILNADNEEEIFKLLGKPKKSTNQEE